MSTTSSRFHIPFPATFLTVNTPAKKSNAPINTSAAISVQPAPSAFLSNRPAGHAERNSVSSVSSASEAGLASPPASPATKATESPVLESQVFTPLPVNTKHTIPVQGTETTTVVEKSDFLSNRL